MSEDIVQRRACIARAAAAPPSHSQPYSDIALLPAGERAKLARQWGFDYIGKFDADIILPPTYFEEVLTAFGRNPKVGLCSGLLYIEREGKWVYEAISRPGHVRGPVKFYSRACFQAIGGLRPFIGWDTADTLLARYHGFEVATLPSLKVKHLRPTGAG